MPSAKRIVITPIIGALLSLFLLESLPLAAFAVDFSPPRRGTPGRREGGGTRDPLGCVQGNPSRLTALVPQTNIGLTSQEYPRFFWYMPKTRAKLVEFTLFEADEKEGDRELVYRTTFRVTNTPGVVSLALPSDANIPPLAVGKDYRWSVTLVCNPDRRQSDISVDGWVQRVTPTAALRNQLATANAGDRVTLYAQNGLWFDTVNALAELRCARPQDKSLSESWTQLLRSVKLPAIAEQPLNQRCGL